MAKYQLKELPVKTDVYLETECVLRPINLGNNTQANGDGVLPVARYDYSGFWPGAA